VSFRIALPPSVSFPGIRAAHAAANFSVYFATLPKKYAAEKIFDAGGVFRYNERRMMERGGSVPRGPPREHSD